MNFPKISIVTVSYNAEEEIENTIVSVISQTYPNIEYIIIDGNSNDNTLNIINKYISKIHKIVSEPDNGIYDAMNKGINMASGEYIIFMNAGDKFYNSNVLENVFKEHDYSDVIYGKVIRHFPNYDYIENPRPIESLNKGMVFDHQAVFVKSQLLKREKFNLNYRIIADFVLLNTLYNQGCSFKFLPEIIAWRDHTRGLTSNAWEKVGLKEKARFFGRDRSLKFFLTYHYELLRRYIYKNILSENFVLKKEMKTLLQRIKNNEIEILK